MRYAVLGEGGVPIDAHFELDGPAIVFHSRGGTKGKDARNSQYEVGLRLVLERLNAAHVPILTALVDSTRARTLPVDLRTILHPEEVSLTPERIFSALSSRMKGVGTDIFNVRGQCDKAHSHRTCRRHVGRQPT